MTDIDYTKFRLSLKRLEEQHDNYQSLDESLSQLNQEAVIESTIQRFETCFDVLWKTLKRYMAEELGIPDIPNSPKKLFREAAENKLVQEPLEDWFGYNDARNDTSHDYDKEKARNCIQTIDSFIVDAIGLYQTITGDSWE